MVELKLFPKHTGILDGTYTRTDADGNLIDKWRSTLTIRKLPDNQYHQESSVRYKCFQRLRIHNIVLTSAMMFATT